MVRNFALIVLLAAAVVIIIQNGAEVSRSHSETRDYSKSQDHPESQNDPVSNDSHDFIKKQSAILNTCVSNMSKRDQEFDDGKSLTEGCACVTDEIRETIDSPLHGFANTIVEASLLERPGNLLTTRIKRQVTNLINQSISGSTIQNTYRQVVSSFRGCGYEVRIAKNDRSDNR